MKKIKVKVDFKIIRKLEYSGNADELIEIEVDDDFDIEEVSESELQSLIKHEIEYLDIDDSSFDEIYEEVNINNYILNYETDDDILTPSQCLRCELIDNICKNCIKKKEGKCKGKL